MTDDGWNRQSGLIPYDPSKQADMLADLLKIVAAVVTEPAFIAIAVGVCKAISELAAQAHWCYGLWHTPLPRPLPCESAAIGAQDLVPGVAHDAVGADRTHAGNPQAPRSPSRSSRASFPGCVDISDRSPPMMRRRRCRP
jgi:hypothetical protein